LELQHAPGEDLKEKFIFLLDKIGVDVENTRFTDLSVLPDEVTMDFNRVRLEDAKERRDRARQAASGGSESSSEYHAEDEESGDNSMNARKLGETEVRRSRMLKSPKDVRSDAVRMANAVAQKRRLEMRERRIGPSGSEPEQKHRRSTDDDDCALDDKRISVAERAYECVVFQKFLRLWKERTVQKVVRRKFFEHQAEVYDRTSLLQQSFDMWKEQRWFARIGERATRRYRLTLLSKTWNNWAHQTAAIVQRTHEVQQRILARKYFNIWKRRVLAQREKVRRFRLQSALYRWMDACQRQRDLGIHALEKYRGNLVSRFYWQWYFAHLDVAVPQRYVECLAHTVLEDWAAKANGMIEMRLMAIEFRRQKDLQKVFAHWVYKTDRNLEDQDHALNHLDLRRRQAVFDSWRHQAGFAPLVKGMLEIVTDRIVYEKFTAWRKHTKNEIAAAEMYKENLARRMLRTWRLTLRHDIMTEHHDVAIQRNTLQQWVRQERLQLLTRTHNRKVARNVIQLFAQRCREKKEMLRRAYRQTAIHHRRSLVRDIFLYWHHRQQFLRERDQHAMNRFGATLLGKTLFTLRDRVAAIRHQEKLAEDAHYYFRAKQALSRWSVAATESRKQRIREAYHVVARNRKRQTAQRFFRRWLAKSDQLWDQDQRATDYAHSQLLELGRNILFNWNARATAVLDHWTEADDIDHRRIVGLAFNSWLENRRRLQEQELRAQVMVHEGQLRLAHKYLKRWDTRQARLGWRHQDAIRQYERTQTARGFSFFLEWHEKATRRQQRQNSSMRQLDSFEDITVIQTSKGATGTVTPLRGFKTPGWKTTGGSRRRGVLGNRILAPSTPIGSPGSPLKRFSAFGRSTLGRVVEPDDEDEGTLIGSGSGARTVGSRSSIAGGL